MVADTQVFASRVAPALVSKCRVSLSGQARKAVADPQLITSPVLVCYGDAIRGRARKVVADTQVLTSRVAPALVPGCVDP